jgi:hypothetical protein
MATTVPGGETVTRNAQSETITGKSQRGMTSIVKETGSEVMPISDPTLRPDRVYIHDAPGHLQNTENSDSSNGRNRTPHLFVQLAQRFPLDPHEPVSYKAVAFGSRGIITSARSYSVHYNTRGYTDLNSWYNMDTWIHETIFENACKYYQLNNRSAPDPAPSSGSMPSPRSPHTTHPQPLPDPRDSSRAYSFDYPDSQTRPV